MKEEYGKQSIFGQDIPSLIRMGVDTTSYRFGVISSEHRPGKEGRGRGVKALWAPGISLTHLVTSFPEARLLSDQG